MHKTEGLVNYQAIYLKPIQMIQDRMDVTFAVLIQIWLWQQCVLVLHNIMGNLNGNMYYAVERNAPVLVYLNKR